MTDVAETRDTERDGVRRTLDEVVAAWARADAPAFRACFTADAAYTTWFGETYRGPDEIAGVHQVLWAGPLAGTRLTAEVADLRTMPATVLSTSLREPLDWPDASVVSGDTVDVVARLKKDSDVPVRSHGSLS